VRPLEIDRVAVELRRATPVVDEDALGACIVEQRFDA
jgi:hypothetical protein